MEDEEALQILASSVFLRSNETPLGAVVTALNLSKYDQVTVPEDSDKVNTFQNVHYYSESEPSTPDLFNCRLENVDFVQCNFQNTEFCNLTLSNVTFLYVDCFNVTLNSLDLQDCIWKFAIAQNAMLVHKLTEDNGNTRTITLEPFKPLDGRHFEDSTIVATRRLTAVPLQAAIDIKRFENGFPASVRVSPTPRHGTLLVLLTDHKHVVSQIVDYCVGEDNASSTEFVYGLCRLIGQLTNQDRERSDDEERSDDKKRNDDVVTFRNRADFNSASKSVHVFFPHSTDDLHLETLALLYASTAKPTMVCECLHGPFHRIQRTVSKPHAIKYDSNTTLVLHYHFEGDSGSIKTDDELLRILFNHIRHGASHLTSIHLMIGKGFWELANWRRGAAAVLGQTSLHNNDRSMGYPNVLANVAKIAAPADR